jgi:hypothetical protein
MCFTVSFEGKAIKAVKEHLINNKNLKMNGEFSDVYYLVSGFSHPRLPVIKKHSIDISEWGLIPSFVTDEEKANELPIISKFPEPFTILFIYKILFSKLPGR